MNQYVFILGKNPILSIAEISAAFPNGKVEKHESYVVLEGEIGDCGQALRRLGGTIKIGAMLEKEFNAQNIAEDLLEQNEGKIIFGISGYSIKALKHESIKTIGLKVKRVLQEDGRKVRFVVSREKILSSVIVKKEKCTEIMVLDNGTMAKTCAVQDFEEYGFRDYSRPAADALSGMLPPKLAKIMINLAQAKPDDIVLDPFCGSGTVLQEAMLLGYKNVIGSDVSEKAIQDTRKNLEWLKKSYQLPVISYQLFQSDVRKLSRHIPQADVIITEPYLGPALTGRESREKIQKIISELETLYLEAFRVFAKILKKGAKMAIIFPVFVYGREQFRLSILADIKKMGFEKKNPQELLYSRSDQKIARSINVFLYHS